MTTILHFPLKLAQEVFAVANTPLFLIRKLKVDPDVHEISRVFDGSYLLKELEQSLQRKPETLRDFVFPYVLLTALFFKDRKIFLNATATLHRKFEDEWFDYARQFLMETYRATEYARVSQTAPYTSVADQPEQASRTTSPTTTVTVRAS